MSRLLTCPSRDRNCSKLRLPQGHHKPRLGFGVHVAGSLAQTGCWTGWARWPILGPKSRGCWPGHCPTFADSPPFLPSPPLLQAWCFQSFRTSLLPLRLPPLCCADSWMPLRRKVRRLGGLGWGEANWAISNWTSHGGRPSVPQCHFTLAASMSVPPPLAHLRVKSAWEWPSHTQSQSEKYLSHGALSWHLE